MAQRLKGEVRDRIVAAAASVFARDGYAAARLVDIAGEAGISTGNLYRYFDSKDTLFGEIVTPNIAARLLKLLRHRVRELGLLNDWSLATFRGSSRADELLGFWIAQRFAVIILLSGARGTCYEHVRPLVIRELTRLASQYLRSRQGNCPVTPTMRFVLTELFARTTDMIVAILQEYDDEASIQVAFALFWRYQLTGLQSLLEPTEFLPDLTHKAQI